VVGGKLNLSGLYRKLGIAKDSVEFGSRAGIDSDMRSFTDDEHSAIVRGMESVYELFLERVASGRGLTREAVREVAEGRIWSGRQASSLGLVDALGGPLEALEEVRRRIGLGEHEAWNLELQPRRTPFSGINELLQSLTGGG
jgi:protease-4